MSFFPSIFHTTVRGSEYVMLYCDTHVVACTSLPDLKSGRPKGMTSLPEVSNSRSSKGRKEKKEKRLSKEYSYNVSKKEKKVAILFGSKDLNKI